MYVDAGFYGTKSTQHFLFVMTPFLLPCDARHGITNFHNYALGQLKARLTRRTPTPTPTHKPCKNPKKNAVDKIHTGTFDLTTSFIGAKSVGVAIGVWSPKMQYLFAAQAVLFHWQRHRNHHGSKARFRLKKSGSHPSHRPCWRFHPPDRGTGNVGPSLRFEPDQVGWTEFLLVKMGGDNLFLFYFFCCWKKTLKVRCCFFGGGVYSVVFFNRYDSWRIVIIRLCMTLYKYINICKYMMQVFAYSV